MFSVLVGLSLLNPITPGVMGFNNDDPRTENIYVSINNRSGSAATITVTLTVLKIGE